MALKNQSTHEKHSEEKHTERPERLFFNLCKRFGRGKRYKAIMQGHPHPFIVQKLKKSWRKQCRIALCKEKHLTTVLFLPDMTSHYSVLQALRALFSKRVIERDEVALRIYGGKLGPEQDSYHYPDILKIDINTRNIDRLSCVFPLTKLTKELGEAIEIEELQTLPDLSIKERTDEEIFFSLQFSYDLTGRREKVSPSVLY